MCTCVCMNLHACDMSVLMKVSEHEQVGYTVCTLNRRVILLKHLAVFI